MIEAQERFLFKGGVREASKPVCLVFESVLPDKVYLDLVSYNVRPFERAPLRCYCCQEYGHVAAVCRKKKRCAKCGESDCDGGCADRNVEPKCAHCGGKHRAGSVECLKQDLEKKVNQLRGRSEAVKKIKNRDVTTEMVFVLLSSFEGKDRSERLQILLDAAKHFLGMENICESDLERSLMEKTLESS